MTVASAAAGFVASPVWANRYRIVDLGAFAPAAINDHGAVAGACRVDLVSHSIDLLHAMLHAGKSFRALSDQGNPSYATSLNKSRQVVGVVREGPPFQEHDQGVLWSPDGTSEDVLLPSRGVDGYPQSVNDAGQVAGYYETSGDPSPRCFLWKPGNDSIDLGLLPGGTYCNAYGVNDHAQVVGAATAPYGQFQYTPHAFLWQAGAMQDLGTLDGIGSYGASALAINGGGEVVGFAYIGPPYATRAFSWKDGQMTDIGNDPDFESSQASAIDTNGDIVGTAQLTSDGFWYAVRFEGGLLIKLIDEVDKPGDWTLGAALSVNDQGEIVGTGTRDVGEPHGFLLEPEQ
jgi:probable HAF family extracellular repeat protein